MTPHTPMPDSQRLDILRVLREQCGLSQTTAARYCGLAGRQARLTLGAWERGDYAPNESRRRAALIRYLWDHLRLRREPERFAALWTILVEAWGWDELSEAEWRGLTQQARPVEAATKPVAAAPFQAPFLIPHFVGRDCILQTIADQLQTGSNIVALVGMGGVGKTTLATRIAHQLRTHFPDGVLWAQTQVSTPLDILNSWAQAFGFDYSSLHDVESCAATLRSALGEKRILIVLDNVESPQVMRPLLLGGQNCAILLTTRSEDVAVALGGQVVKLAELAFAESLQLLVNLLGRARVEQESRAAEAICQSVHHLPLALEIVGQLLVVRNRRSLTQIAQRLQDVQYRLDLQISDRDVRTSFLVSWETLDIEHRRVFSHLAIFEGRSFTASALAAVLGNELDDIIEQLDTLVARSVVSRAAEDRYYQHPLLADFAREQLGDAPTVWYRFTISQLEFARRHQQHFALLEPEWENLMAGMRSAYWLQQWQLTLEYARTFTEPWLAQARYTQAKQGYTWAIEAAQALEDLPLLTHYLIQLGFIWCELSDFGQASRTLQNALEVATLVRSDPLTAEAQYHLARIALEQGDYEACDAFLSDCQSIRETLQDERGLAKALHLRGILARRTGKYALAEQLGHEALQIQAAENDIPGLLGTYYLLIDCALATQKYELGKEYCQHSLRILDVHQRKAELAETYFSLAMLHRYTESPADAWRYIEHSRELAEHIGSRAFLSYIFYEQSRIKFQIGEVDQALHIGLTSLALMSELNDDFNRVVCLRFLGDLYNHKAAHNKAVELWQAGAQLALELHHPETHILRERLGRA